MFTKGNALIFYQFLSTRCRDISLENEYEDNGAQRVGYSYRKSSIKPPLVGGGLIYLNTFEGGLI